MDIAELLRELAKSGYDAEVIDRSKDMMEVAADEIERLREALHHCVKALAEFEKDSNLPIEQFQYNVVFKLKGYLLGALDTAKLAIGGE